jgi:glycosyltransferase involved in cell wall biosynthesis
MTTLPTISVIVPTYNRAAYLPYLFQSLAMQQYPAGRFEVLVVDNSSKDQTAQLVARWQPVLPFELRFYSKDNEGPAASRNYGAMRAHGEVLAFTDSDCVPTPRWLRQAAHAFAAGGDMVTGTLTPIWREGDGLLSAQDAPVTNDTGLYMTANFFVRSTSFRTVNGFDERFGLFPWGGLIGGEDIDLGWRLKRSGATSRFCADVEVLHLATRTTLVRKALSPAMLQVLPKLLRSIPELRKTLLWARWFLSRARASFYMAVAGLALALSLQWWPALLLILPWLQHQLRRNVLPAARRSGLIAGIAAMGLILYLEAATTLIVLAASVRYRRLVL